MLGHILQDNRANAVDGIIDHGDAVEWEVCVFTCVRIRYLNYRSPQERRLSPILSDLKIMLGPSHTHCVCMLTSVLTQD